MSARRASPVTHGRRGYRRRDGVYVRSATVHGRTAAAAAVGAVVIIIGLVAWSHARPSPGSGTDTAAGPTAQRSSTDARAVSGRGSPSTAGIVRTGTGWTAAGVSGPVRAAGSCRYRHARSGELLPDPACTPGAVDTGVTPATLGSTVCRRGGYTATVRPPEALSTAAKRKVMAAYGVPWGKARDYELDHLIELSAGGSSDLRNLWPEPNTTLRTATTSRYVHNDKDALEAWTFQALCAHKVMLPAVQMAVATDWTTALAGLHLPPIPPGYRG